MARLSHAAAFLLGHAVNGWRPKPRISDARDEAVAIANFIAAADPVGMNDPRPGNGINIILAA